jgi:hypothetical protein
VNNNRPYTFSRKKKRLLISYTCPDFRDCYGINIDYISAGRSRKNTEDRGQRAEFIFRIWDCGFRIGEVIEHRG